jgi:hypothetical protein
LKILVTIAHFFDSRGDRFYGSTGPNAQQRIHGLTQCVASLHQSLGKAQTKLVELSRPILTPVTKVQTNDIDVVICTTGGNHLVGQLPVPEAMYEHREVEAEPMLLGFACHEVLRDRLGEYDYYCYLEDDLAIQDPWFFAKLKWFTDRASDEALLQPNRFELSIAEPIRKLYIDGHISVDFASEWQDIRDRPRLNATVFGVRVTFERTPNPHSGCFFVNSNQMATWAERPYFLDRDVSFAGQLESAATLGIMKTFRIYKPAVANAGFLEILHTNNRYLGHRLKVDPKRG